MNKKRRIFASAVLCLAMVAGSLSTGQTGESLAAAKAKLSKKSVSVTVKKTKKVSVQHAKGKKVKWSVKNKSIASIKKSGKYAVKITGKKKGKTTLFCKVKTGKKWSTLKCAVVVKPKANEKNTPAPGKTENPTDTPAPSTVPSADPTKAPVPSTVPSTNPTGTPVPSTAPSAPSTFEPKEYKKAGFETGTDGFVGRGTASLSTVSGGHTGKAMSVKGRTNDWNGAAIDVTSSIAKGAEYSLSAWVKQDEGSDKTIKVSVELEASGKTTYPKVCEKMCKSGEWTYVEGSYTVPEHFTKIQFYFEGPDGNYDFLVDDVLITQKTQGKEPVDPAALPSIKDSYQNIFGRMGNILTYNSSQMQDEGIMKFMRKHYNSFTLENEMKPEAILSNWSGGNISVSEAKKLGYVIPDNYKESMVAKLNFDTIDKVLSKAKENGLQMRSHVLLWHAQTATRFFKVNYEDSKGLVSKDVMDARLEFYIKSVMKHVMEKEKELTGSAGTIVYCWDVVNEYIHRKKENDKASWVDIYGDMKMQPTYVKNAFKFAYSMLEQYDVQDKVTLFYNDFNEYDCADDIVTLINYINKGEKAKICSGIGMQSHLSTNYPPIKRYENALDKFLATGLEVQVTELDIEIDSNKTEEDQAARYKEIMSALRKKHENRDKTVNPRGITGVTMWGLYDSLSWRKNKQPLPFGSGFNDPKPAFYAMIEAAK